MPKDGITNLSGSICSACSAFKLLLTSNSVKFEIDGGPIVEYFI